MHYLNVVLKIIHVDLKPQNIFLNREENGTIKAVVGDFGSAIHASINENFRTMFVNGTLQYTVCLKMIINERVSLK